MADPDTLSKNFPAADLPHAPYVYFEPAVAFGFNSGVANVSLAAERIWIADDGECKIDRTIVAYLRANIPAMRALRDAIDKSLLLAAPSEGGKAN
jgi:hypothetical protein